MTHQMAPHHPMTHDELMAAEVDLEADAVRLAVERYRHRLSVVGLHETQAGADLMRRVMADAVAAIETAKADAQGGKAGKGVGIARYISQFESDHIALLVLRRMMEAIGAEWTATATMRAIWEDLEAYDLTARLKSEDKRNFERYQRYAKAVEKGKNGPRYRSGKLRIALLRHQAGYWQTFNSHSIFTVDENFEWRTPGMLFDLIAKATGLCELALQRLQPDGTLKKWPSYRVVPTPEAEAIIEALHGQLEIRRPVMLPMVVPPIPWKAIEGGGYLSPRIGKTRPLMKAGGVYKHELANADFPLVFEAINAIQNTRWRVNTRVLEAIKQSFLADRRGLPKSLEGMEPPPRLPFMEFPKDTWSEAQQKDFESWKRAMRDFKAARNKALKQNMTIDSQVYIANKMARFEAIYFPHQLDWRGRAYPMPAFLQPQGDQMARGLLEFADAEPLGEFGVKWLVIHGANSFGVDKVSFAERMAWVRQHHADILADAEDPQRAYPLWTKADSPHVFLAFAFEWAALSRWHGAPEDFPSRLPVGIDGSCNGLQHYSAALRDARGGAATNLIPSSTPADIYRLVAIEVNRRLELDLIADDEDTRRFAGFWLSVGIDRSWTKRNTMTLPYGVSEFGMKDQLWQLIGGDKGSREFFPAEEFPRGAAVRYLTRLNWESVTTTVVAAQQGMAWLQDVAGRFNRLEVRPGVRGLPILWTTPDGLAIRQSYKRTKSVRVSLCHKTIQLRLKIAMAELDSRRQVSGIAPNFIHSIDAAHMRAVVRRLAAEGVTGFAMVHDSFGTHAGRVERLAQVTREEFVAIHQGNVLSQFHYAIRPLLPDCPPPPEAGDLDLEAIKDAEYFFA